MLEKFVFHALFCEDWTPLRVKSDKGFGHNFKLYLKQCVWTQFQIVFKALGASGHNSWGLPTVCLAAGKDTISNRIYRLTIFSKVPSAMLLTPVAGNNHVTRQSEPKRLWLCRCTL